MTSPSLLAAARLAPDRHERILKMAELMRHHREGPEGACTFVHLAVAGFTAAEIETYRDDARAVLERRPSALRSTPPYRLQGMLLARRARQIRDHGDRRAWAAPVVELIDG